MIQAKALIETARPLAKNEREEARLFAAVSHQADGARAAAAVAVLDRHLMSHPYDLVAHQAAALADGFLGRFHWVRDRSARALPRWSKDQPGYATMLAYHAFGAEEAGDYARAEAESREAAELEPTSFWPHHTVSHVMEMTGRPEDGLGWMAAREKLWSTPTHTNRVHIWWHKALFHVELGQYEAALALYDGPIRATQRRLGNSLRPTPRRSCGGLDTARLRHRRALAGAAGAVGRPCRRQMPRLHRHPRRGDGRGSSAPAARRWSNAGSRRCATRRRARPRRPQLYRAVGVPVVEGLMAFRRGAYDAAIEKLLQTRTDLWQIGGSHAQRDVVTWTLNEAAIRAGRRDIALSLAHERLGTRPRSAPNRRFLQHAVALAAELTNDAALPIW